VDRSETHASKRLKRGLAFSKAGQAELTAMMDRLISNLRMVASLFMTDDPRAARLLADEKVAFREAESTPLLQIFRGFA
jgi:phosphate:Na+ symporter